MNQRQKFIEALLHSHLRRGMERSYGEDTIEIRIGKETSLFNIYDGILGLCSWVERHTNHYHSPTKKFEQGHFIFH